jgi:hypothetical protein
MFNEMGAMDNLGCKKSTAHMTAEGQGRRCRRRQQLVRLPSKTLPDRGHPRTYVLSLGSNPCGYPHEPLVNYRINRQLSG